MPSFRRIALLAVAAPFALAACGESADDALPTGEPLAPITAPAGTSWVEAAATTPEGGVVIGNPNAPIKLVEYASHTCGACAAFSTSAAGPLDEYVAKGTVSYEIRNQVHNPVDLTLAALMRCGEPSAFHPLANQVWANLPAVMARVQQDPAALEAAMRVPEAQRFQQIAEAAGLLDFFAARGVSRDQAMQCLANVDQVRKIAENSETQSAELNVTGTPTFFLNGKLVQGTAWTDIEPALQAAGAR